MTDYAKPVSERRRTLVEKWRSTPEGLRDSRAVRATFEVVKLIDQAMEESNTSRDELAERLEVSRERVDEILDVSPGNIRITTLARILSVCGFELNLSSQKDF